MSFGNALNEAARDADVIRMFARGKGFLATVTIENSFRLGVAFDFIAMLSILEYYMGWEFCVVFALVGAYMYRIYTETASLLFSSASIVKYWRPELGYDITLVLNDLQLTLRISFRGCSHWCCHC
jgi:hypothetical protein